MKYKFSVIIPVYNVEDYLEETILSVVDQTIGFRENIQMILVNDGSPDNSEEICIKYRDLYPENIIYVSQKNGGVSAARNNGYKYATGKYINFLDSDDKWQKDAFEKAYNFLEEHDEVDLVACMLEYFEAQTGTGHPLNFKFDADRVVDIMEEPHIIQMNAASAFVRKSAIDKIDNRFDSNLKYGEDSFFSNKIILQKKKYGILKSVHYLYRKRFSANSAIDVGVKKLNYYTDTVNNFHKGLIEYSKKVCGEVIEYIQYAIMYDFQWRLFMKRNVILDNKKYKEYLDVLKEVLNEIDDNVIANFDFNPKYKNYYFLKMKYNSNKKLRIENGKVYFNSIYLCELEELTVRIDNLKVYGNKIKIYGQVYDTFDKCDLCFMDEKDNKYEVSYYDLDSENEILRCINEKYAVKKKGFTIELDLEKAKHYMPCFVVKDKIYSMHIEFGICSNLNSTFASLYLRGTKNLVKYNKVNKRFDIYKNTFKNRVTFELKCIVNLLKKDRIKSLILRECANFLNLFKDREIWLITDRINVAGDNGEAFFKYVIEKQLNPDIKYYFAIDKRSADYKRLNQEYSNVIDINSFRYKMLFLLSDKVISAHADEIVINPLGKGKKFLSDLYNHKYVFLQHGVTFNDLSPWLNINNKDISMFVANTKEEYKSLYEFNYNFQEDVPRLTGMPRYDYLLDKDIDVKKQVVIMPTWRNSLVTKTDIKTGKKCYDSTFKKTDYFKFYNALINDKRILDACRKKGYKIRFIPHPNMMQQIKDFEKNDVVEIVKKNVVYRDEFKANKLLVTDFSSVHFDFAYLNKPIIYTQFDVDTFYEGQIYQKGYFEYERDGFGPVCYDYETSVKEIVKAIRNDCKLTKKYEKRIDECFMYRDQNNCKRVYDEILKLK